MKRALIVVSFGTSDPEAEKAIIHIEQALQLLCPNHLFFRAFTSHRIIEKLKRERNLDIESTKELLERFYQEGFSEVLCQPTHVMNGIEYGKMLGMIQEYQHKFKSIKVGVPLLTAEEDFRECAAVVMKQVPRLKKTEAFVLMGHGTNHFANGAYSQFENTLRYLGFENVYIGTVEGFPDVEYVLQRLARKKIEKVYMMPLMIVAGEHAKHDLAGVQADSWRSVFKAKGYQTEVILRGLGEIDEIAAIFQRHLEKAEVL